jgi:hypothetical protein
MLLLMWLLLLLLLRCCCRDVMVGQGFIQDRRYKFAPSGHVVYVGET